MNVLYYSRKYAKLALLRTFSRQLRLWNLQALPPWAVLPRKPLFSSVFYSMSISTSSHRDLVAFLHSSFPSIIPATTSEADISGTISPQLYPNTSYTDNEKVEISQWLTASSHLIASEEDEAKHAERLGSLNNHLSTRTTLLGSKPSIADIVVFYRLAPAVNSWNTEERTGEHGYRYIVRYIDFVQNAPLFGLSLSPDDKIKINASDVKYIYKPVDPKEEKERKKKEKATAANLGGQAPSLVDRTREGKGKGQDTTSQSKIAMASDAMPHLSKKEKKKRLPKLPSNHLKSHPSPHTS